MSKLKLHGFPVSNYFNKVRLVLLEKGIDHELDMGVGPSQEEAFRQRSPMGKIPILETEQGLIVESHVICEYLEDAYPIKPLFPRDLYARAKVRELLQTLELHVELVVRRVYGEAFFGGKIPDHVKEEVKVALEKGARALSQLAKFSPYIAGPEFTIADCAAAMHIPYISGASKIIFGADALAGMPQIAEYLKLVYSRPSVQQVDADRQKAAAALAARSKS